MKLAKLFTALLLTTPLSVLAAPGDILFEEQFNSEADLGVDWLEDENQGNAIQVTSDTAQSPSTSVRIGRRGGSITSIVERINANVPAATLTFWVRRGADSFSEDPDSGENLIAEYRNNSDSWIALETFFGDGTPGEIFNRSFDLPADALHSGLQLRFRHTGGNNGNFDYWHIDDVVVTEANAPTPQQCETFRDNFGAVSYSNNDGSANWSNDWQEQDTGGPSSGLVFIQNGALNLSGDNTIANRFAARQADTSGFTSATLSFDFQAIGGLESEDAVLIEVSGDGGSSFTQLERIEGISGSASGNRNYDISGAIAANTQVRIRIAPDNNTDGCCYGGGGETFIVDNLEVEACRDVPQPTPQPVAEWRFDEPSWNGISGEVGDASGNNLTGTANGADTVSGSPANTSADGTSTCNYGEFNGSSDFIALGNPAAINFAGEITMTAWIRPDRSDGIRNILEHGFRFSPNQAVYLRTNNNFYQSGSWNGLDYVATVAIPNGDVGTGTWVHVAGVYDGSTWRFYRNGVQVASRIDPVGAITVDEDWAIGARGTGTQRFFDGGIDEVRIYNVDLTAAQVQDVMNDTRSCPVNGPDHYSISAANGVACAPIDVTVAAHDSGHSLVDAQGSTVTLTTSTGRGTWSGSGVTDATPGDGTATLTFAPGASSANIQLSYTDIDIGDGTPNSDTFTVTVSDGAVDNSAHRPASTVSLSGFQFGTGNFSAGIANQTAGVNDNSLRLRAVRTDTNGNCTALYPNQTRSIGLAATYRNPTAGAGVAPTIIGNTINSVANGPLPTTYTPVNLSFDANSIANLSDGSNGFNYNDVGQLQLHARDGSNPLLTAQGSSNDFVVRPHHFDITVSGNPGTTASGNGFIAAGAPFGATVTARTNTNAIARNYGNEASPESVAVTINSLVIPVGGNSGGLSPGTATGGNGSFTVTGLSWNNVGTITLLADVADGNYLGTGNGASNPQPSGNVGRFYPASLALTAASASNGCGTFSYLSQPNIAVSYNLAARNTGGGTTSNYSTDSDGNAATLNYPVATIGHRALQGATDLSGRLVIDSAQWVNGVYALNTPSAAINRQASTTPDGPFASVQLSLTENDPDSAISGSSNVGSPLNLRFGRAFIDSAHGPESTLLNVPFGTQYWDGNRFVASTSDSCSAIAVDQIQFNSAAVSASPQGVDFIGGASDDSTGTFFFTAPSATTTNGTFGLLFSPPGAGNTGSFPINIDLTNYPWLRSDWNQDGSFDDINLPEATVSFGSYRGHDRVIYWRERFD